MSSREPIERSFWDRVVEHFWSWGALAVALLLAALGTTGVGFSFRSGVVDTTLFLGSLVVLSAGYLLNVANQLHSKRASKKEERRREKHLTRFNDELASVLEVVTELLLSDKDEEASERFFRAAIREARHLVSHEGVRICVYEFESKEVDDNDNGAEVTDPVFLSLKAFGGRGDPPRARFTSETEHGAQVIKTANGNVALRISDPSKVNFKVDRPDEAVWNSALLVPVKDGTEPLGILMIDTRDRVNFSLEDVSVGWTISTITALGMGVLVQGGRDPLPEALEALKKLKSFREREPDGEGTEND